MIFLLDLKGCPGNCRIIVYINVPICFQSKCMNELSCRLCGDDDFCEAVKAVHSIQIKNVLNRTTDIVCVCVSVFFRLLPPNLLKGIMNGQSVNEFGMLGSLSFRLNGDSEWRKHARSKRKKSAYSSQLTMSQRSPQ